MWEKVAILRTLLRPRFPDVPRKELSTGFHCKTFFGRTDDGNHSAVTGISEPSSEGFFHLQGGIFYGYRIRCSTVHCRHFRIGGQQGHSSGIGEKGDSGSSSAKRDGSSDPAGGGQYPEMFGQNDRPTLQRGYVAPDSIQQTECPNSSVRFESDVGIISSQPSSEGFLFLRNLKKQLSCGMLLSVFRTMRHRLEHRLQEESGTKTVAKTPCFLMF